MHPQGNNPDLHQHSTDTTMNNDVEEMNKTEAKHGVGSRMSDNFSHQKGGAEPLVLADMDTIMTESRTITEFQSDIRHILTSDLTDAPPATPPKKRKSEEFKVPADRIMEDTLNRKPRLEDGEKKLFGEGKDSAIAPPHRSIGVLKDQMSYMLPNVTWDEQAKRESDFVGDAYYYDLEYEGIQRKVAGTYVVVYSRPLTIESKPCGTMETYTPNFLKNYIEVFFAASAVASHWAVGSLNFNNRQLTFKINEDYTDSIKADATMIKGPSVDEGAVSSMLDMILELGPREGDSSASFGIKWMRQAQDNNGRSTILGFYFVALEVATFNFDTGEDGKQLVIGIKVPPESQPDVPSAFLLNQRVVFPKDMCCTKYVRRHPGTTINLEHLQRNGKKDGTKETIGHAMSSKKRQEPSTDDYV